MPQFKTKEPLVLHFPDFPDYPEPPLWSFHPTSKDPCDSLFNLYEKPYESNLLEDVIYIDWDEEITVISGYIQSQTEPLASDNVESFITVTPPSNTDPEKSNKAVLLEKVPANRSSLQLTRWSNISPLFKMIMFLFTKLCEFQPIFS